MGLPCAKRIAIMNLLDEGKMSRRHPPLHHELIANLFHLLREALLIVVAKR